MELGDFLFRGDANRDQKLDYEEFKTSMKLLSLDPLPEDDDDFHESKDANSIRRRKSRMRRRKSKYGRMSVGAGQRRRKQGTEDLISSDLALQVSLFNPQDKDADKVVDIKQPEVRENLFRVFRQLDSEKKGSIDIAAISALQGRIPAANPETQNERLAKAKQGVKTKSGAPAEKFGMEEFVVLMDKYQLTNRELQELADAASWTSMQKSEAIDLTQMSMGDIRTSLGGLRHEWLRNTAIEPPNEQGMSPEMAALAKKHHEQQLMWQKQLQIAVSMADNLLEKYNEQVKKNTTLEQQVRRLRDRGEIFFVDLI